MYVEYTHKLTIKIVIIVIKKINESHQKIKNEGLGKAFFFFKDWCTRI